MKEQVTVTGKTVDEAVAKAVEQPVLTIHHPLQRIPEEPVHIVEVNGLDQAGRLEIGGNALHEQYVLAALIWLFVTLADVYHRHRIAWYSLLHSEGTYVGVVHRIVGCQIEAAQPLQTVLAVVFPYCGYARMLQAYDVVPPAVHSLIIGFFEPGNVAVLKGVGAKRH